MNALTGAANTAVDDDTRDDAAKIEERARRIGWVPKDEFRGDPAKWAPADEFLERGERTLPILLERNRKIDDRLGKAEKDNKTLRDQLADMNGTLKEARDTFVEFRERTANVEQRAYQRARDELVAERDAAVAAADPAAFKAADTALTELDKTAPKPVATPRKAAKADGEEDDDAGRREQRKEPEKRTEAPEISETTKTWLDENPWFKTDKKAGAKAVALHGANLVAGMSEEESLEDVRVTIEATRPDLFENPRREAAPSVRTPTGGTGRKERGRGRTFDDLPQEAKDAYTRFAKQDKKFTKDDYLRDYIWD